MEDWDTRFDVMQKVLFICTGNYYRSRLADVLFNYYASVAKAEWEATSRGLADAGGLRSLSDDALAYLKIKGLESFVDETRDPKPIKVSDLEDSDLIIALNRKEHEGMMREKFGQIPRFLESNGKLRYWNIYDIPLDEPMGLKALFMAKSSRPSQPTNSSVEHVDFAVKLLLHELTQTQIPATLEPPISQGSQATE